MIFYLQQKKPVSKEDKSLSLETGFSFKIRYLCYLIDYSALTYFFVSANIKESASCQVKIVNPVALAFFRFITEYWGRFAF